ncbi:hypothetical protein Calab_1165 [Caldithrix abyssi DSM 13497]|uniref:Uncharacterized protein n=1 Tax=Caldithrix abyssi DSM 13497 TaxID=880073 RepID=H1XX56_CALAY|nr:hypothetical protein Calab_1165 [Caldithrix abyssi DSM 13497]
MALKDVVPLFPKIVLRKTTGKTELEAQAGATS